MFCPFSIQLLIPTHQYDPHQIPPVSFSGIPYAPPDHVNHQFEIAYQFFFYWHKHPLKPTPSSLPSPLSTPNSPLHITPHSGTCQLQPQFCSTAVESHCAGWKLQFSFIFKPINVCGIFRCYSGRCCTFLSYLSIYFVISLFHIFHLSLEFWASKLWIIETWDKKTMFWLWGSLCPLRSVRSFYFSYLNVD